MLALGACEGADSRRPTPDGERRTTATLPSCPTDIPPDWATVTLRIAPASLRLPVALLGGRMGPDGDRFEGWYGTGAQILVSTTTDTSRPSMSSGCLMRRGRATTTVRFVARGPRPPSTDSVYGAILVTRLADDRALRLEIGAEGRDRFESLLPLLSTLTPLRP